MNQLNRAAGGRRISPIFTIPFSFEFRTIILHAIEFRGHSQNVAALAELRATVLRILNGMATEPVGQDHNGVK